MNPHRHLGPPRPRAPAASAPAGRGGRRALRRPAALPIAAALVVLAAAAPSAAAAGPFTSWSVAPSAFFQETFYATTTTVANGRIWQVSFDRQTKPVLRSRRLADGRAAAVPVRIPRPRGGQLLTEGETLPDDTDARDPELFVAGNRGFVAGDWCTRQNDDGDCEASRGFSVQFDVRTGRTLRSARPQRSPLLVGGTRVSVLEISKAGSMLLRDAVTRRVVRTIPRQAREIQGAGPYVSWKDPDAYERENGAPGTVDVGPNWSAIHVRERTSGRTVYDLRESTLMNAIQRRGAGGQDVDLQADGSLRLAIDLDFERPFRPVAVDGAGRILRVSERAMRRPNQFWTEIRGGRVSLQVSTNFGTCGPDVGWITDVGGHHGNALGALPRSRNHVVSGMPSFLTPTTITWSERLTGEDAPPNRYRQRVGGDVRVLPLSTAERPRC